MALTPGTRLGPYEVIARLGAGGMGEFYRACDPCLDRQACARTASASRCSPRVKRRWEALLEWERRVIGA